MFSKLRSNVLAETVCDSPVDSYRDEGALNFLRKQLSTKDASHLTKEIKYQFTWAKQAPNFKRKQGEPKLRPKKLNRLSGRQKKLLGLNKIDKKGLKYDDFKLANQCWTQYISEYLKIYDLEERGLELVDHASWEEFSVNLWKADLHGAFVRVVRSKCPVFVGVRGFIVWETKNTYKILDVDNITRCIPKESCEFSLRINNYELKFLGKNMMVKPNERANKKAKAFSFVNL